MRQIPILLAILFLQVMSSALGRATAEAWAVPTFESLGLYYNLEGPRSECNVFYRAAGAVGWRQGYPLVYDLRKRQYRGSLVGLKPDTRYDIRLEAGDSKVDLQARTLSETL